ncbi:hypothetical protein A0J61_00395 [Choanephora cucurbitarum]|uniref:Uncharacterized protein n=1 Tax=Choanephora cucurbitarum TaxID=101091 RepID=A0A1C7NSH3_9FUNG|nr:hypothetical protein A0J61_00395 [Choanephora cucurbitarum]
MSAETSSPNNRHNTTNKKYPNTPKSPLMNNANVGGNRSQTARNRLLSSKISAPRPINLPSLKSEHEGTEHPIPTTSSPATGWRSNTNSPSLNHNNHSPEEKPADNTTSLLENTTRAWAITEPSSKTSTDKPDLKVDKSESDPKQDLKNDDVNDKKKNPSLSDDKEYLKYASSDPNHTSWDEMVSEDLGEFSVDVIEFDDGTKVQIENTVEDAPVSPSDRFPDDYDRSYHRSHPPAHHNDHYKPFYHNQRRSEDHYRYDNSRRSSAPWPRRDSFEHRGRRPSYESRSPPPPPMQRSRRLSEHSARSDHSKEEHGNPLQIIPEPEEITVAQKNLMLTAAERAKKRRDEQEAEYAAAAERARQKAAALAALAEQQSPKKEEEHEPKQKSKEVPIKILQKKHEPVVSTDKPWNMVVVGSSPASSPTKAPAEALTEATATETTSTDAVKNKVNDAAKNAYAKAPVEAHTEKPSEDTSKSTVSELSREHMVTITTIDMTEPEKPKEQPKKPATEDEAKWAAYVSRVRHDTRASSPASTSNDWNLYANRLTAPKSTSPEKLKANEQTEYMDYQEEWNIAPPSHPPHRAPWTLEEVSQPRRSSKTNFKSETRKPINGEPGTVSILKPNRSGKTKPSVLLKEANAPLFPVFMEHIVGKKPANMSFMVDMDESDKDITMMHCAIIEEETTKTAAYSPYYPILVYHHPQQSSEAVYLMPPKQREPSSSGQPHSCRVQHSMPEHSDHFPSLTNLNQSLQHRSRNTSYRKKRREPNNKQQ